MTSTGSVSGLLFTYTICSVPDTRRSGGMVEIVIAYRARFCQYAGPGRPFMDRVPLRYVCVMARGM